MIAKMATKMATYFSNKGIFNQEDIAVYSYGFELLISSILNGLGIILISIFMGITFEAMLFMLAFIPLRLAAGGYHAKHHLTCGIAINITFLFFAVTLSHTRENFMSYYIIFSATISAFIVWLRAPVEAINKPISENKRKRLRERSIVLSTINIIIALLFYFVPLLSARFAAYYLSGALASSLSMIVASIEKKAGKFDND